jgi:oligopeptide transport system ATP-binding protein
MAFGMRWTSGYRSTMDTLRYVDLRVQYSTPGGGATNAVDGVSFEVSTGSCIGIVGESGSGKTHLLLAASGLLPRSAVVSGRIEFNGSNLLLLDARAWQATRGRNIATIFQDPMTCFTPHLRIESQLTEVLWCRRRLRGAEARSEVLRILDAVQVSSASDLLRQYPHELSGGTLQRVLVAMALLNEPRILIADEPTASLDATTQLGILKLLSELRRTVKMGLVLISHDLRAVQAVADQVVVMYAGRVAEYGPTSAVLTAPKHPYTIGLIRGTPFVALPRRSRLEAIPGEPILGGAPSVGCAFWSRCGRVQGRCSVERPQLRRADSTSQVACHLIAEWTPHT